jgi:hypothetical protein
LSGYDIVPPEHGEPDYSAAAWGAGSNVYSDDAWDALADEPAAPAEELEAA